MKKRLQVPGALDFITESVLMRVQLPDCKLHMELWDTAGAERFRSMCYAPLTPSPHPIHFTLLLLQGPRYTSAMLAALYCPLSPFAAPSQRR